MEFNGCEESREDLLRDRPPEICHRNIELWENHTWKERGFYKSGTNVESVSLPTIILCNYLLNNLTLPARLLVKEGKDLILFTVNSTEPVIVPSIAQVCQYR
jgi:hypothetical protein